MIHTQCACTRVRRAARALTDLYDVALQPVGLKVTQFSLLRTVQRMDSVSISMLAEEMALDRSTLGRNLRVLERMELVDVSEAEDLRARLVALTPRAERLLEQALPLWEAAQRKVSRLLGSPEVKNLFDVLEQVEILR
jgi:DNA-binding MarR family transcriptional regulator